MNSLYEFYNISLRCCLLFFVYGETRVWLYLIICSNAHVLWCVWCRTPALVCRVFCCLVTNPLPHYCLPLNFFSVFFPSGTCTILMQFGHFHALALLLGHSSGQSSTNIEPFLNSMHESLSVPTLNSSISTMKSSQVQRQACRLRHAHIRTHTLGRRDIHV